MGLTRPSNEDKIEKAVRQALANCNVTSTPSAQRVVLYDDVDAVIQSKMVWGWVVLGCGSICWAPLAALYAGLGYAVWSLPAGLG